MFSIFNIFFKIKYKDLKVIKIIIIFNTFIFSNLLGSISIKDTAVFMSILFFLIFLLFF